VYEVGVDAQPGKVLENKKEEPHARIRLYLNYLEDYATEICHLLPQPLPAQSKC
jgi:hypothetical protein